MTALGVVVTALLLPALVVRELARIGAVGADARPRRLADAATTPLLIAFVLIAALRLWQLS